MKFIILIFLGIAVQSQRVYNPESCRGKVDKYGDFMKYLDRGEYSGGDPSTHYCSSFKYACSSVSGSFKRYCAKSCCEYEHGTLRPTKSPTTQRPTNSPTTKNPTNSPTSFPTNSPTYKRCNRPNIPVHNIHDESGTLNSIVPVLTPGGTCDNALDVETRCAGLADGYDMTGLHFRNYDSCVIENNLAIAGPFCSEHESFEIRKLHDIKKGCERSCCKITYRKNLEITHGDTCYWKCPTGSIYGNDNTNVPIICSNGVWILGYGGNGKNLECIATQQPTMPTNRPTNRPTVKGYVHNCDEKIDSWPGYCEYMFQYFANPTNNYYCGGSKSTIYSKNMKRYCAQSCCKKAYA